MCVTIKFLSVFPDLRGGKKVFTVKSATLNKIIDQLENIIPGIKEKLVTEKEEHILHR